MLFMITYSIRPEHRDPAQARFRSTGGLPPEGARMIGRWHQVAGLRGFVLCESVDHVAMGKWIQDWSDLLTFEVIPVANDEDIIKVIGA